MQDYVTIANLALMQAGEADRIVAPDENANSAKAVRAAWDSCRRFVIAKANFSFALRRRALAARPANPEFPIIGFSHAFPLPPEMVRFVQILDAELEATEYSIEGGPLGDEILIDHPGPLNVQICVDVEDVSRWTPSFVEAFSYRLAADIVDPLSGDKGRKDRAGNLFDRALRSAKQENNRRKARQEKATGEFVLARGGVAAAPGL